MKYQTLEERSMRQWANWLWDVVYLICACLLVLIPAAYAELTPRPIPEKNWHYHMLPLEYIGDVCSTFVKGGTNGAVACSFRNYVTNECHIFLTPNALFAKDHEERHCKGKDHD